MIRRTAVAGLVACFVIALSGLGLDEVWFTRASIVGLSITGIGPVLVSSSTTYFAGSYHYEVEFWCTPTIMTLCGCALLWMGRQRAQAYFLSCIGLAVFSTILLVGNVIVSIHLREWGVDWIWAHYPGYVLVHIVSLWSCVAYVAKRQKNRQSEAGATKVTAGSAKGGVRMVSDMEVRL